MRRVSLVICIHNHQPVGNLPGVFRHAYDHAYEPFLAAMESFPEIRFVLHNTGPLLEWIEQNEPSYIERVRALVERGQTEILTGGFYEPILTAIPPRDAIGQIERMTAYVEDRFGTTPRGMWLAERVWEPTLAATLARAGVEYLPVDDYEFQLAGLPTSELSGHYITEDQGLPVAVFPISKQLRYAIPFQDAEATIEALRALSERGPGLCAVFGDDGEKFGVWPGTHAHVYGNGWLRSFLTALKDNSDWVETTTFADFVDATPPRGRVYLPASSYPEMMEWALPTEARRNYARMLEELKAEGRFDEWGPYLSGGTWRGFVTKYDESNVMVRKMMRVSDKLCRARKTIERLRELNHLTEATREAGTGREPAVDPCAADQAATELWRGQCNCAYWHGVFGGLYLPHLRAAIFEHLIKAENLLDSARGKHWSTLDVLDHDLDGRDEVLLETHWANVYVAPARGGTLFELDLRAPAWNLLGTMSRYDEAYHDHVKGTEGGRDAHGGATHEAPSGGDVPSDGVASIHDTLEPREKGLERLAIADALPRRSAIDRFVARGTARVDFERGRAPDLGDFADAPYAFAPSRLSGGIGVAMTRLGTISEAEVTLRKKVCIEPDDTINVEYLLSRGDARANGRPREDGDGLSATTGIDAVMACEWNLAFLTGDGEYTCFDGDGIEAAAGSARRTLENVSELCATDRLRGARIRLSFEPACTVWLYPLETASQSEGGLERVYQGTTLVATWDLSADVGSRLAEAGPRGAEAGSRDPRAECEDAAPVGSRRFVVSLATETLEET